MSNVSIPDENQRKSEDVLISEGDRQTQRYKLNPKTDFSQDHFSKLRPKSRAYLYDFIISSLVGDRASSL